MEASKALVRKRDDTELMAPPPPPAKKIKRPKTVLDEDTYAEGLSHIIARDFFPGLVETESQQEYLDALESKDKEWIASAGLRLRDVMTPGRRATGRGQAPTATPTAYGADTPASTVPDAVPARKPAVDTDMSLSAYQAKHTSEDNESFYKLLDRQNQKRRDRHAWAWNGNKVPSKQMIAQKKVEERLAATRSLVDDGFKRDRLAIKDRDERPARPNTWPSRPRNNFMFNPDGVEDEMETVAQRSAQASLMSPKRINYKNTRIPQERPAGRPPSPTLSAVRDAIAGRPRDRDRDSVIGGGGGDTPRVNGYAFVDDEDDEPEEARDVPIIDLGPGDATPNPFRLAESRKRESLHHKLVDRIAESKKTASRVGMTGRPERTPAPKFPNSPRVSGGLTPAAQRLWSRLGSSRAGTPMSAFGGETPSRPKGSGLRSSQK